MRSLFFRNLFPFVLLLTCAQLLAVERTCVRCNAKAESDKWVYCPYCGTKYESADTPSQTESRLERGKYERVTLEKIKVDYDKFKGRFVCFQAQYNGIHHHYAPVEILGITEANYVNFFIIGNQTNYVKRSAVKVVERLQRVPLHAIITIYARIEVLKKFTEPPIIVVLMDDFDL